VYYKEMALSISAEPPRSRTALKIGFPSDSVSVYGITSRCRRDDATIHEQCCDLADGKTNHNVTRESSSQYRASGVAN